MWRYVLKRLLLMIPVLLGVMIFIFFVMELSPGDPASTILAPERRRRPSISSTTR
jgi:peptide/nickel transport system permease protein